MWFTLISIQGTIEGKRYGSVVQGHYGDLESATCTAIATEKANGDKLDIAVLAGFDTYRERFNCAACATRLDVRRAVTC